VSEADRERWDRRWSEGTHCEGGGSLAWLDELRADWPRGRRALDVACGAGRVALWLAQRGFDVLGVDVSPVALARLDASARAVGRSVETLALDLEREPLPGGPFDWIACFAYLQRDLFPAFRARLGPGGLLVCEIATVRNLERHEHPSRRFLLEPGELVGLVSPLEIVRADEGWHEDRHLARVACRMPE
jgi:SAM-dependent methyltransferase